jgi:hypothetical protein
MLVGLRLCSVVYNENRWIRVHALQVMLIAGEIVCMFSSSV